MINSYSSYIIRHHKFVVISCLLLAVLLAAGAKNLTFTNDFQVFFSEENPQLKAFNHLEEIYGKQDSLSFYIYSKNQTIFTQKTLALVYQLTDEGWQLPFADRVSSLANYQHTTSENDTLSTRALIDNPDELGAIQIESIKHIAMNEPTLMSRLIGPAGNATIVLVTLDMPKDDIKAPNEVVEYAEAVLGKYRTLYPEVEINIAGTATAGVNLGRAVQNDLSSLVVTSYLVIVVGLIILLRSVRASVMVIVFISLAVISTMGVFGWFDTVLTPVAGWVPSIVMTISVADAVHIIISYFHGLRKGLNREDAVKHSLRLNASPVFITSLTTIIGVLCLNFSDSPPYRDLGNMVAIGVLIAYLLSMSFIPALLCWVNIGKAHVGKGEYVAMKHLSEFVMKQRRVLLIIMGVSTVILACFIPQNKLTERWLNYYDDSFEIRRTIDSIDVHLSGVHAVRYEIHSNRVEGIFEPDYLLELEKMALWFKQQQGVVFVSSVADIIKRLNKTFHNNESAYYRIPETSEQIKQLYFLYELGLPPELSMVDTVNSDRSSSVLLVVLNKTHSARLLELEEMANEWIKSNMSQIAVGEATGLDSIFAHLNYRNTISLLEGTLAALFAISLVLIITLRSVKLGLLSLIPNLVPAILAYGTWALLIGEVDLSASVVICMSLGIVVDDTVHFLSKFLRAQREEGLDVVQAMHYAFNTVGMALLITTIVLVAGFLVLATSHFSPTWVTGLLMAIILAYALLADFLLLPPLIVSLQKVLGLQK